MWTLRWSLLSTVFTTKRMPLNTYLKGFRFSWSRCWESKQWVTLSLSLDTIWTNYNRILNQLFKLITYIIGTDRHGFKAVSNICFECISNDRLPMYLEYIYHPNLLLNYESSTDALMMYAATSKLVHQFPLSFHPCLTCRLQHDLNENFVQCYLRLCTEWL